MGRAGCLSLAYLPALLWMEGVQDGVRSPGYDPCEEHGLLE